MKNVSSLKSNNTNSPKTPGGISKSLLTPCRRVGLSRNWRKSGPSPFISPVTSSVEAQEEKSEGRKRKERVLEDSNENLSITPNVARKETNDDQLCDTENTPSRNVEVPRRKKSKTLLTAINKSQEDIDNISEVTITNSKIENNIEISKVKEDLITEVVSTPVRTKSKKSKKQSPSSKRNSKEEKVKLKQKLPDNSLQATDILHGKPVEIEEPIYKIKEKSPNDLRKECIVVIQRKIFKKIEYNENDEQNSKSSKNKSEKSSSQALFDSDSDDLPLNQISNKDMEKSDTGYKQNENINKTKINKEDEDDDFIDKEKPKKVIVVPKAKSPKIQKTKSSKTKVEKAKEKPKPLSQSSCDEDDDFDNKKTIIVRKTYDKVVKPSKAKSTGSITQNDIDELRARIEAKKKLLLAKSINPDTEELRTLIKKWQKGCQDALIELLDLMKTKFHDKQDMDYSEMLKTLKIPPLLVGYDSKNDCFNTPDDASIILGQFND
ncbi:gelsolin-related protein of 125 kDa-like [Trichoplusia ni]|uniref:Gelsolin-related protein of 125 kDa-like n=1 Tax=Trichoplusia ni TaxID=7111 RepID=A0A7E5VLU9_TRINI|nr:gelsolin-related protein of 125 kDa-like [Trichoplusia ni]